ncbi:MAG: metallophosphoesterase [Pseudomonadota bacterium]
MLTRRGFIKGATRLVMGGALLGGYAVAGEPFRLSVTRYRVTLDDWPKDQHLRIAALADIHACTPWMGPDRIARIVERTNGLGADLIVLLGDYTTGHRLTRQQVHSTVWAPILGELSAPLGVHAVMGNHDWWEDRTAQKIGHGPTFGHRALGAAGVNVLSNQAIKLPMGESGLWLAGLEDQLALLPGHGGRRRKTGVDDLEGTLAGITDSAPAILLAHEPDVFPKVPARVALTLSGHTHGGQVRLFGHSPIVPSRHGNRYAYGQVREADAAGKNRDLIVSGGLGCSILPVRFGMPPEIVVVDLEAPVPTKFRV